MNKSITCCFTGHRPEKMTFSLARYSFDHHVFKQDLEYAIHSAILRGYRHFITGMSRGMDLWAAMFVLDFKRAYPGITLEAAIPCPGQANRWPEEDQRTYQLIRHRCDREVVLSPRYTTYCMQERNRYMVDASSLLIAAYNGSPGGTRNTCSYARQHGVDIYNVLSDEKDYPGTLY